MPKVTEEYIQRKKKKITDAAYELCIEKTVSNVTMQDIINRTGLSQGGIYRFYHGIDEIFADMLDEMRERITIKESVDEIFSREEDASAGEIVDRIFEMLGDVMEKELMGIQKVDFEFSVLAMNAPQRVEKILAGAKGVANKEYLMTRCAEYFQGKEASGELKLQIDGTELMAFISSAYTGIQTSCIVQNCYQKGKVAEAYRPKAQFLILAKTVKYLLGIEENGM